MLEDVLRTFGGAEVEPMHLYRSMFRLGSGEIQRSDEAPGEFKSNPIGYFKNASENKGHYRILFEDTFEEVLAELQEADFAIVNGTTYFGRKNVQNRASKMYGMIFDLDGVTDETLTEFLSAASRDMYIEYPLPNYITLSGHGCHLYYIFDEPIALYPNIKLQLKELKFALTTLIWNEYTSRQKKPQYQGCNQGFRPAGGKTKIPGTVVRAFWMRPEKYTLAELNRYVPEKSRIDETAVWKAHKMTLAAAKKKYPEWYKSRIEEHQPRGTWTVKRDLYDWWLRTIYPKPAGGCATFHHRYFCIMMLAIYGVKCGVPEEEVRADAMSLIPVFNVIHADDPFTKADVDAAMECYDPAYKFFPIKDITALSAIPIEKNKRNGRKQSAHVKLMTAARDIDYPDGEWRGRPSKEAEVRAWLAEHPDATPTAAAKALGVSRPTIYKYMK